MDVTQWSIWLITLGGLFFLGLAADLLGRRTFLPRATVLLLFGFLIGPSAFDLLPDLSKEWFPRVADMALVMIGFLLGGELTLSAMRRNGREVIAISLSVVIITALMVFAGLTLIGVQHDIALILAAVATSTAPLAVSDVIRQSGTTGNFSRILMGIVALDDAWGLIVFIFLLMIATLLNHSGTPVNVLLQGLWELMGALLLGVVMGVPIALLTGRIRPGEPTLVEALGAVFLCGGIALWLGVSHILAAMVMGVVVANMARHHERPFRAIKNIDWPFKVMFFILAGASLQLDLLLEAGWAGVAYIVLRILGRFAGTQLGGAVTHCSTAERRWMGMALMPQAGVALGMALVAGQHFPEIADMLITIVVGATVFFEIIGPVMTRLALRRMGEGAEGR